MSGDKNWNLAMAGRLRLLRRSRGLTQRVAGEATGLGREAISNYERGCRTPTPWTLAALARLYETTTDHILGLGQYPRTPDGGQNVLESGGVREVTGVAGTISVGVGDTVAVEPCDALDNWELGLAEVGGTVKFVRYLTIGSAQAVMAGDGSEPGQRCAVRVIGRVRAVRFSRDRSLDRERE